VETLIATIHVLSDSKLIVDYWYLFAGVEHGGNKRKQSGEIISREMLNRRSTDNMYTSRREQLRNSTFSSHNPSIPPQHRAPAVNPTVSQTIANTTTVSPPDYNLQYEQPILTHKTSVESINTEESVINNPTTSGDTNTSSDELYVNTNNVRNISQSVGLHRTPNKSPIPAPREMSKENATQPITYVSNVTIVDGYTAW